jgi:FKBP-type peptidyl-prolyl cis-trans isomerase FkpA
MHKIICFIALVALFYFPARAQNKTTVDTGGYTTINSGLCYKIVKHGRHRRTPKIDDHIEMHIHVHVGDSIIFDSRQMNNNISVPFQITAPKFDGDPVQGFMKMHKGDSAVFKVPVAAMKKSGNQFLPWMNDSQYIEYNVVIVSLMSEKELNRDIAKKTARQKKKDKKLLLQYFEKHSIHAVETPSGLYYTILTPGKGDNAQAGDTVSVNYTGKLISGSIFDSNTDPAFRHREPYKFELGKGRVIKGWDEGLMLLNKGARAILFIPAHLAYGSQDRSPQIPANSILIFDVELLDIVKR